MLRLAPGRAEIIDEAPFGRAYKDGKLVGNFDDLGIGERRKLAFAGIVIVSILIDKNMEITGDPELETFGLPEKGQGGRVDRRHAVRRCLECH